MPPLADSTTLIPSDPVADLRPLPQVLLVEDDPDQAALLRRWLEQGGLCQVTHAADGLHGLHLASSRPWDLILSDVNLPGCDGIEVVRFAKQSNPGTPVLVLTANADVNVAVDALRCRVEDFLVKPVEEATLVRKVREVMEAVREVRRQTRRSVLAIGAHPDDVEIGCGGILLDHVSQGDEVTILTLSRGEHGGAVNTRVLESERAAAAIGATLRIHDLPDAGIGEGRDTITVIEQAIEACRPTIIYTHTPHDAHQDHRNVHRATLVAGRRVPEIYCYQSPSSTTEFRPTRFVEIGTWLDRKIEILAAFESQFRVRAYLGPELISATASYWGRFADLGRVEPLEVIRSTR